MSEPRTGRDTDRDVDRALSAWMDQVAPNRAPARLLEETFAHTMGTGQQRAYPWHKVGLGRLGSAGAGSGARIVFALIALVVLALSVGLVGGGGLWQAAPSSPSPIPTLGPTPGASAGPSLPPAVSVAPEATIPVQGPITIVLDGTALWVMSPGRLDRIDPATNGVTASVTLGAASDLYNGLAANAAGLWATDADAAVVYRVDPTTLKVAATIPVGFSPKGVLATADGVWVADVHGGTVLRIDPATNTVVATITVGPIGNSGPNWLAIGLGSIWVDVPNNRTISRIDALTDTVQATIETPPEVLACGGIAVGDVAVWVSSCSERTLMARVDPSSNTVVATVGLGGYGYSPTLINGAPWVSVDTGDANSGMLVRIDPATNTVDRVLTPGAPFGGGGDIVVAAGSVWVIDGYNNAVIRLPLAAFGP